MRRADGSSLGFGSMLACVVMVAVAAFSSGCDDGTKGVDGLSRSPVDRNVYCCPLGGDCGEFSYGGSYDPRVDPPYRCSGVTDTRASGPSLTDEFGCPYYPGSSTETCLPLPDGDTFDDDGEVTEVRDTTGLTDDQMIACQNDDDDCPSPEDSSILCCPVSQEGSCNCTDLGGADLPDDRFGCQSACDSRLSGTPSRDAYGCMKIESSDQSCEIVGGP